MINSNWIVNRSTPFLGQTAILDVNEIVLIICPHKELGLPTIHLEWPLAKWCISKNDIVSFPTRKCEAMSEF